jgi:Big-like domain-containing protein
MDTVNKKYISFCLLLVICLFSCKKEEDSSGPKITFNTPVENQTFNVYDYVTVNASVTDDHKIAAVSVSLMDNAQHLIHNTVNVSVSSPSGTINYQYLLDNIHLLTGVYYIRIFATDGINDSYKYQKIYIIEAPRVLQKVFVVSNTSSAQTNLSYIDPSFSSIVPFHSFTGDHLASSVSSYDQQAYICGNYTGAFAGHILQFNGPRFSIPAVTSSNPYFTGYYNDERDTYVARYNGTIRGYDYAGTVIYSAAALGGYYPQKFCFNDDYLIAEEKEVLSSTRQLVTYFPNGGFEKSCALTQDVVAYGEKDATNVFIFGNTAGQATLRLFDRINNNIWSPYPFPLATGSMLSALKIDPDTYLIGHSNGTIYKYQYSIGSVTTYLTGYTAVQLKYDDLNNILYVVESNRVSTFNYTSSAPVNTVNSTENILDVHLLYNR